jgi:protein O-mannosyl-transferase
VVHEHENRTTWIVGTLIAVLTVVVMGTGLRGQMIFDDYRSIVANSDIEHFPDVVQGSTRPLTEFTFFLNYAMHGADVVPYHVVNVLIHTFAALLLFGVLRRTLLLPRFAGRYTRSASWLAGSIAAMWAVHPVQTESVTYIVQRAESMMGMFALLGLYSCLRGVTRGVRGWWMGVAVLSMVLGMLSKPVMVVMPMLVLLFDAMFLSDGFGPALRRRWRFYLLLAMTLIIPLVLLSMPNESSTSAGFGLGRLSSWRYLLSQCDVVVHYLKLCVWPHPLCIDYAWLPVAGLGAVWCTALSLLVLLGVTLVLVARHQPAGYLGCWFFLTLLPTSSVVPLDDLAAERRLYLALLAPIALVVLGGVQPLVIRFRWRVNAVLLSVVVLGTLSLLTIRRNLCYTSEACMWQSVLETRPEHVRARLGLGSFALAAGELDVAERRFREVLERLPRTIPSGPSPTATLYSLTQTNLGVVHEQQRQFDLAEACFREAIRVSRDNTDARVNLGIVLGREGATSESLSLWQEALRIEPHHARARYCMGWAAMQSGDVKAAVLYLTDLAEGRGPLSDQARAMLSQIPPGE